MTMNNSTFQDTPYHWLRWAFRLKTAQHKQKAVESSCGASATLCETVKSCLNKRFMTFRLRYQNMCPVVENIMRKDFIAHIFFHHDEMQFILQNDVPGIGHKCM